MEKNIKEHEDKYWHIKKGIVLPITLSLTYIILVIMDLICKFKYIPDPEPFFLTAGLSLISMLEVASIIIVPIYIFKKAHKK